jgi:putative ABC transport system permease protein
MIKNHLRTAFREVFKHKTFSVIHILGLSLGIAAFVLILKYTFYELSYENFYENADQIYRLRQDRYDNGKLSTTWGAGCPAIGPALLKEFPEVIAFGRLVNVKGIININENEFREERMYAANSSFLTMLPVQVVSGIDSTALDEPYTAAISETIADKYFGNQDVIGKTFKLNNEAVFKITAVFHDIPENTHLKYNILISWPTYVKWRGPEIETAWFWDGFFTYLKLRKGTDILSFEKKVNDFTARQTADFTKQYNQSSKYILQSFKSIHLHSNLMWEAEANGNAKTVYFLIAIAFIILIIAWVNYINLSTVKAIFRSKEVAVRKITGAFRINIIKQFLIESFIINLISSLFAYFIVIISLPFLRILTGRAMSLNTPDTWLAFISIIFIGPIVAGIYPALLVSSFKPVIIFRGKLKGSSGSTFIRKALIVFQFAVSIILIAVTFTVYNQLSYMSSQELGVNIDQTLVIKGPGVADSTYNEKLSAFKAELLKYPIIKSISASTSVPGSKVSWNAGGIRRTTDDISKSNQYRIIGIDYDFIDAYNLTILTGRNFSREFSTDEDCVIINEKALKMLGFETPKSAIATEIYFWGNNYKIIGILKDYHQESLKEDYDALIFRLTPGTRDYFSLKLNYNGEVGSDVFKVIGNAIKEIKENWEQCFPGNPFDYFFLSDYYNKQYHAEKQFRTIFEIFAILAICIACLGLFGLSWFIIVQRTKEIGIHKINGASPIEILILLSGNFLRLVSLSIIIAAPFAFIISRNWLVKFPNRVVFNWWIYLLEGFVILIISALTISYNTFVIAGMNPSKSLKYE